MRRRFIKALSVTLFYLGRAYARIGVGLDSRAWREINGVLRELVANGYIRSTEADIIADILREVDRRLKEGEIKPIVSLVEEVMEEWSG